MDKNLAIQSIPKEYDIIIPVGIIAAKSKEIEISIASKNIDAELKVYLEDRELEIFTLLTNDQEGYKFTPEESTNAKN